MTDAKVTAITMKKLISAAAILIAALSIVSCSNSTDDSNIPEGMIRASGEAASYILYIPDDWQVDLQTGVTTAHVSSDDPSNISAAAWELEHTDDTIDTWWEVNLAELENAFTDYTEIYSGDTELGGIPAKEYIYTAKLGGAEYKYMQVAAVRSGSVYVITYTALPEVFDSHTDEVSEILDAFRF